MTPLTERLAQAQGQQKQIEDQIAAYQREIERLAPQLWAAKGRTSLLIEMVQEEERYNREASTPPVNPAAAAPGEPEQPE